MPDASHVIGPPTHRPAYGSAPPNQSRANTAVIFIAVVIGAIIVLFLLTSFCNGMAERGVHF
jgi:hypothetical protein